MSPGRRNIGILAHIDAGKTTVTEQLLYHGGLIRRPGAVDQGTTVSDWMVDEQERGITIASAASCFPWRDVEITVVDTPGHVDFTIEVERSLRVLDGAVVVVSGPDGVQAQTETVWLQAARHGLPAVVFVNKLDREGVVPEEVVRQVGERLGVQVVPLQVVVPELGGWCVIDVLTGEVAHWPSGDGDPAEEPEPDDADLMRVLRLEALERLTNAVASYDDAYAAAILDGLEQSPAQHRAALRRATLARDAVPLIFGIAREGQGIEALADAIVDFLPAPEERTAIAFDREGMQVVVAPGGPPCAYVFKTEPRRDRRLVFVRAFAGSFDSGQGLVRAPAGPTYAARPFAVVFGRDYEPIATLSYGQIAALVYEGGDRIPRTGDTLGLEPLPFTMERIVPPEPVLELTVEAPDAASHERMLVALQGQCEDDPSLRLGHERSTGRTLLAGMGELHLEVALKRIARVLGFEPRAGRPQVLHRHVLAGAAEGVAEVHHPTGRARVRLVVEVAPGEGFKIEAPRLERPDLRDAVISGLEAAAGVDGSGDRPLLGGHIAATVVDLQGTDIVPIMLRDAAEWAALRAIEAAGHLQAEPWAHLEVVVPDVAVGRVVGDLARRRARLKGSESRGPVQTIACEAPISELIGYATELRSVTAGRGSFTLEPIGYRAAEDER